MTHSNSGLIYNSTKDSVTEKNIIQYDGNNPKEFVIDEDTKKNKIALSFKFTVEKGYEFKHDPSLSFIKEANGKHILKEKKTEKGLGEYFVTQDTTSGQWKVTIDANTIGSSVIIDPPIKGANVEVEITGSSHLSSIDKKKCAHREKNWFCC